MNFMITKEELRLAIKNRLLQMSDNDRRVESNIIMRELRKILPKEPTVIAAFAPYLDEPNISLLITELIEQKNVICMGKMENSRMSMHRIASMQDIHKNPTTGIKEPVNDEPEDEESINIVLVPGRAFTVDGDRLGRGNGGYDRWIALQRKRNPATRFIGICFDHQLVQEIPMEKHDEPVDIVITASKIYGEEKE